MSTVLSLSDFPLVLAGPIVRRVDRDTATIWFVLTAQKNIKLEIYSDDANTLVAGNTKYGLGMGAGFFLYCITAIAGADITDSSSNVISGVNAFDLYPAIYHYDLIDTAANTSILAGMDLAYGTDSLPSFCLPASSFDKVKIVHGSCRKPHGEGFDALSRLDGFLNAAATNNNTTRPQQLFLSGDQIYADDVSCDILKHIRIMIPTLFGWTEKVPTALSSFFVDKPTCVDEKNEKKAATLNRNSDKITIPKQNKLTTASNTSGLSGLPNQQQFSQNHILSFQEFILMYVMVWSDVPWNIVNNTHTDAISNPYVTDFKSTISTVRKALANIATYTAFDDHDVTNGWNFNYQWCKEVYSRPYGKRIIFNGILAYAYCQAWGNDPEHFAAKAENLLVTNYPALKTHFEAQETIKTDVANLLSIPDYTGTTAPDHALTPHTDAIDWHYYLAYDGVPYDVMVFDSRTMREFPPGGNSEFAGLISQAGYDLQVNPTTKTDKKVIVAVLGTPAIGQPYVEQFQLSKADYKERYDADAEALALDEKAALRFFSWLARKFNLAQNADKNNVIVLSGDVHYGFTAESVLETVSSNGKFFDDTGTNPSKKIKFIQCTASSLKNQVNGLLWSIDATEQFHDHGYMDVYRPGTNIGIVKSDLPQEDYPDMFDLIGRNQAYDTQATAHLNIYKHQINKEMSSLNEWTYKTTYLKNHGTTFAGSGNHIVGWNNIGLIEFEIDGNTTKLHHKIHWGHSQTFNSISDFISDLLL